MHHGWWCQTHDEVAARDILPLTLILSSSLGKFMAQWVGGWTIGQQSSLDKRWRHEFEGASPEGGRRSWWWCPWQQRTSPITHFMTATTCSVDAACSESHHNREPPRAHLRIHDPPSPSPSLFFASALPPAPSRWRQHNNNTIMAGHE